MLHRDVLRFGKARYLWWSLGLVAASIVLYLTQRGPIPRSGDSWQGYVLGTVGALLIAWLSFLGIRKRSYSSTSGTVEGWVSAHVYLGLALTAVATLHCAFQFGWNVHTLAYALTLAVVGSGIVGLYGYLNLPRRLALIRRSGTRGELFAELFELDKAGRNLARRCDPEITAAVISGIERTVVGGGLVAQFMAHDRSRLLQGAALVSNADQQPLVDFVAARVPRADKAAEAETLQALLAVLCNRQAVLRRLRRDIQLSALLQLWLYVHVPLTVALLAALVVHIVSTFIYW
jgi:hypothetical protein